MNNHKDFIAFIIILTIIVIILYMFFEFYCFYVNYKKYKKYFEKDKIEKEELKKKEMQILKDNAKAKSQICNYLKRVFNTIEYFDLLNTDNTIVVPKEVLTEIITLYYFRSNDNNSITKINNILKDIDYQLKEEK